MKTHKDSVQDICERRNDDWGLSGWYKNSRGSKSC